MLDMTVRMTYEEWKAQAVGLDLREMVRVTGQPGGEPVTSRVGTVELLQFDAVRDEVDQLLGWSVKVRVRPEAT
jgi:hypothetical protein